MKRLVALLLIGLAAACTSGGGGPACDEAPEGGCLVTANFCEPPGGNPQAQSSGAAADPDAVVGVAQLSDAAPFDILQLELIRGFGAFQTSITTGRFELTGDELDYATCGVCPRIFTDCTTTECAAQQFYVTGGTVEVTSLSPNFEFTLSDLTFVEVTIDETTFESTPVANGCETEIGTLSFSAAVQNQP